MSVSKFWKTEDLEEGDKVMLRRLGPGCPGEYLGIVRGVYACDADGHPDAYIVQILDQIPGKKFSCAVFPRGCVDKI